MEFTAVHWPHRIARSGIGRRNYFFAFFAFLATFFAGFFAAFLAFFAIMYFPPFQPDAEWRSGYS